MKNKKGRIAIILGLLLIAAALGLVMYNTWEDNHAYEENMSVMAELEQLIPTQAPMPTQTQTTPPPAASPTQTGESLPPITAGPTPLPTAAPTQMPKDHELDPSMPMPTANVQGTDYVGILEVPSLNLKLSVASELTRANLKVAPCRHTGSVYTNDMTIGAHNYSNFFGGIINLHIGAEVRFTDLNGNVFIYRVSEVEVLSADQGAQLIDNTPRFGNNDPQNPGNNNQNPGNTTHYPDNDNPDGNPYSPDNSHQNPDNTHHYPDGMTAWDLTLFTCTKRNNNTRDVVRCKRVG